MKTKNATLTQRVMLALIGVVTFFVTVLALFAYLAFDRVEDDMVNSFLEVETQRVQDRFELGDGGAALREIRDHGGALHAWLVPVSGTLGSLPELLHGMEPGLHLIEQGLLTWHVDVVDISEGRLFMVYDASDNEDRVRAFGLYVLGLGVIIILVAWGLSRRIARIAVGPMLELTQRLGNWAPDMPGPSVVSDDEAGQLMQAFHRMQSRIEQLIAREREFFANLSHEIRTPLAAIRSDGELMLMDASLSQNENAIMRLTRMIANVDEITGALASMRAMSSDRPGRAEPVGLRACMEDAWRGLEDAAAHAGMRFKNDIDDGAVRLLDRYALLMVLRNLVRNAIEHAATATLLTASLDDAGALQLRDDGQGIAAAELPFLFERYHSTRLRDSAARAQDAETDLPRGLGLAIAKRVCDRQGWLLNVQSSVDGPARGACFTLIFDSAGSNT